MKNDQQWIALLAIVSLFVLGCAVFSAIKAPPLGDDREAIVIEVSEDYRW